MVSLLLKIKLKNLPDLRNYHLFRAKLSTSYTLQKYDLILILSALFVAVVKYEF